jgi:hypothetical protein
MSLEKTVPHPLAGSPGMAQTTAFEEIIEVYLRDVDRTLIRENLALTPDSDSRNLRNSLTSCSRPRNRIASLQRSIRMPNRFKSLLEVLAAAGRPKDFESVAELRAIKEEREKQ